MNMAKVKLTAILIHTVQHNVEFLGHALIIANCSKAEAATLHTDVRFHGNKVVCTIHEDEGRKDVIDVL